MFSLKKVKAGQFPNRPSFASSRSVSRVLFPHTHCTGGNHSSGSAVANTLEQPTRPFKRCGQHLGSYLALLRGGFTMPCLSPDMRWALTPPFHPCPRPSPEATAKLFASWPPPQDFGRFVFCGTIPMLRAANQFPGWHPFARSPLATPPPYGARTFLGAG